MIKRLIISALPVIFSSTLPASSKPDQFSVYAGAFDVMREAHRTFEFGLEYKFNPSWRSPFHFLEFRPLLGVMTNALKSSYLYGGINFDLFATDSLVIAPGFAAGWYNRAEGKNLGFPLEFRTSIEFVWQFHDLSRLGIRFYHLSNASIGSRNPGEESLVLLYDIPVRKGFSHTKTN
jgi:lipid A 3-O-deacylase